jgi:hypothetical protein
MKSDQSRVKQTEAELGSFLKTFEEYAIEVFGSRRREHLDTLRSSLQKREPLVTRYILDVLGDGLLDVGSFGRSARVKYRYLLATALMGGNNELALNFADFRAPVTMLLNRALGTLESGLWSPRGPDPVLVIKDDELRSRCSDLLSSPGLYDRVIREATTILESRIRSKCPADRLAALIPNEADRTGDKLVNQLFNPDHPVLVISDEKGKRIAFHRILLGVFSYLRNRYHHNIDSSTEWSWAWSTVGFIDRLLAEVEGCSVSR